MVKEIKDYQRKKLRKTLKHIQKNTISKKMKTLLKLNQIFSYLKHKKQQKITPTPKPSVPTKLSNFTKHKNKPAQQSHSHTHQLHISGIPYDATQQQILEFFKQCGNIQRIHLPKYQDSGRFIGYGHINFQTKQEAQKALKKSGQYLKDRYLTITYAKGEKKQITNIEQKIKNLPKNCKTIFIKNLSYQIQEEEIKKFLKTCGPVKQVRMVFNSVNKKFKGFAYVQFQYESSVKKALFLNGTKLKDREVHIDYQQTRPRKGYHNRIELLK